MDLSQESNHYGPVKLSISAWKKIYGEVRMKNNKGSF